MARVNSLLRDEIAHVLERDIEFPGVSLVSVVRVDAAADLGLPFGFRVFGSLGWIDVGKEDAAIRRWDGRTRTIACPADRPSSLAVGVDEIVTCLSGGGDVSATGEDARDALEVIVAFHLSSRLDGRWVSLPLEGDDRDLEVMSG